MNLKTNNRKKIAIKISLLTNFLLISVPAMLLGVTGLAEAQTNTTEQSQWQTAKTTQRDDPLHIINTSEPTTKRELSRLMNHYHNYHFSELATVLDRLFEHEARNESWAKPIERNIVQVAATVNELSITGECRLSLCRYDFTFSNTVQRDITLNIFNQRFRDFNLGKDVNIASMGYSTFYDEVRLRFDGFRIYFYSTKLPAEFVIPLIHEMERHS